MEIITNMSMPFAVACVGFFAMVVAIYLIRTVSRS